MKNSDYIKYFGLNNLTIEAELRRIQRSTEMDIGHSTLNNKSRESNYYPQFTERLRREADEMGRHYAIFYCLENFIRELISERLEELYGPDWWNTNVPPNVKDNAVKNQRKEAQSGVTLRSNRMIDYSNFGELGEIIKSNWNIFGETFRDIEALQNVLGRLNTLRAPIAHCKALAEDEIVRLHLSLRDWFRQMS